MLYIFRFLLCLVCFYTAFPLSGSTASENPTLATSITSPAADPVTIELLNQEDTVLPGKSFWIAIRLNIDNGWHAYWKNPGDAGMAPVITWNLPKDFQVTSLLWPTPKRFVLGSTNSFGYEKAVILLAEISPPSSYAEKSVTIGADVRWVVCSDTTCLPGESETTFSLPVSKKAPTSNPRTADLFRMARSQIPQKADSIQALRKQDLIEIAFTHSTRSDVVQRADFFPEERKTIDYAVPTLLQRTPEIPHHYTILLKEASPVSSLKGILVLQTSAGDEAYDVNIPILPNSNEDTMVSMTVPHGVAEIEDSSTRQSNSDFQGGLILALVLAFFGGLLLNLMPCVLPVISLKVLSFVKLANQSRKLIFQHGLAFSLGILISFWVLAGLLLILQAYGNSVGWGFQLQEPLFVAALAALLFVFALSLFGLFEMGTSLMAAAGQAQHASSKSHQMLASFFSGVLATVVATPCTGPFLGTAVGFAVTLPSIQALMIFTFLGLGMSLPYLLLAAFPALLHFIPKPGAWMGIFKELMGFLMLAAVVWLIWVFSAQTNGLAVSLLLGGFFFLALAGWVYGRWGTPIHRQLTRSVAMLIALALFSCGSYTIVTASSSWIETLGAVSSPQKMNEVGAAGAWEEFSPERVAALRKQGIPVFIDFTAKWCLICQANHLILSAEEVAKQFVKQGVVKMKADWTKSDRIITEELRKFGRNSVPLYVLYGADNEEARILPQILTSDVVLTALRELEEAK